MRQRANETGCVLIVDDRRFEREKLQIALRSLGHEPLLAASASEAWRLLRQADVDSILLDIEMPDVSGLEMLAELKSDPATAHVPVIVVSSLDGDRRTVLDAIERGAEDFLPKRFHRALLRARLDVCLAKKRRRDIELDRLHVVARLELAARLVEAGHDPAALPLDEIAGDDEPLTRLSRVFSSMAREVHDREARLRRRVRTLKGVGAMVLLGVVSGADAPLARAMSAFDAHPVGLSLWMTAVVAALTLPWAILKRDLPPMSWSSLRYFLVWGFCLSILCDVFLLTAARHMSGTVLSIVMVAEVLMVFAWSALMRLEAVTGRRFAGLLISTLGIVLVLWLREDASGDSSLLWAMLALAVPFGFAVTDIMSASDDDLRIGGVARAGFGSLAGLALLLPLAIRQDAFVPLATMPLELGVLLGAWGMLDAVTITATILLLRHTGAIFGSQVASVQTLAGVGLSVVFLGEMVTPLIGGGLLAVIVGLLMVEPKREAAPTLPDEMIERLRRRRTSPAPPASGAPGATGRAT